MGASLSSPRLRVHDTTLVQPSPSPPETSLPLDFFDIFWLHSPPVERLFFYRLAPDADVATIVSNLKGSLHHAVSAFYPLAGHLRLSPGTSGRYELYYRPGDAVTFNVDIDGLTTDDPGSSADARPLPPVIDRALLPDPRGLYDIISQAAPGTGDLEFVKMSADQILATFTLSKDDLRRVKDVMADEAATLGVAPPRCSSLVATFGFVWWCYQRAKESGGGGECPMAHMVFPVDHRSRMEPRLPEEYLGNCVGPAFAVAPKGELAAAGAGGLFSACAAVASAIDEAVRGIGTSSMDAWVDRIMEAAAAGVLSVRGRLAEPAKVDVVSVARTGAVAVAESRSRAGGMEVGVSLQPAGMDRYRKCIADAVAWVHNHQS
ncbi:malonyl-CoA:anthocyanidin 5-O-glucoside-6' [Panicum miliaceum]|uniref:Malonyl-CoA:anthocyanidin 5-O-glucoside-6 n=1 Tax=Panicum miliaceum TaxID=4540 RepID=A0A3L6R423_PANMI|nr:malonyl-CoA:anthocyanidin 5-O-glucoside-6' [Panicum miliaceum]